MTLDRARWRDSRLAGLPVADVVVAALLLLVAVPSAATGRPPEGPAWVTVPVALLMCGALAWRTRAPLVALVVVVSSAELQTVVSQQPGSLWSLAAFLLVAYSVAATSTEARAALGGALLVGVLWLQEWQDDGEDYLFIVLVFGGTWLLGRLVQSWRARATVAELNQEERARLAVAEERARIARELHDIVAHGLSVIAVQADAAEAVLAVDPQRARQPITVIRSSAREALDEMRRMLTLLRLDEQEPGRPQPGLDDVPDLVRSVHAAGLPLTLRVRGVRRPLPPGVDLSAYRIVQEALTNVIKHAGAPSTLVVVEHADEYVVVEVSNGPAQGRVTAPRSLPSSGHGLVGIRERVALVDGELRTGPVGDGGFVVRARLPRSQRAGGTG